MNGTVLSRASQTTRFRRFFFVLGCVPGVLLLIKFGVICLCKQKNNNNSYMDDDDTVVIVVHVTMGKL